MLKIKTRDELPLLLNDLELIGKGVEIGVECGHYSNVILEHSKIECLYSIDSWKEMSKKEYQDINNHNQKKHNQNKRETEQKLNQYGDRSKILQMTSEKAVKLFQDNSLDFVYLDANHKYEAIKQDIELWYPKVKEGGIFAGHDYIEDGQHSEGMFGVKKAVNEFIKKHKLRLFLTSESWTTWWVIKK